MADRFLADNAVRTIVDESTTPEPLDGFVDRIEGGKAYRTITRPNGDFWHSEQSGAMLAKMTELGIKERRRFGCLIVDGTFCITEAKP